jgi:pimeloyl-ACP methyl ester carboxylesterase
MQPSRSGHLPINGLQLYFEAHGELGPAATVPLLLIPGAFMSTDSMKQWVSAFAAKRPVIVFDQQGHGRTPDTARAMSYEQFADDAAAVLRALAVERVDVMGYSQGGGVAIQLALRHPERVSKLVTLSATYRQDGWYPSVLEGLKGLSGGLFADILPATSHVSISGAVTVLEPMITAFLDDLPPANPSLW